MTVVLSHKNWQAEVSVVFHALLKHTEFMSFVQIQYFHVVTAFDDMLRDKNRDVVLFQ